MSFSSPSQFLDEAFRVSLSLTHSCHLVPHRYLVLQYSLLTLAAVVSTSNRVGHEGEGEAEVGASPCGNEGVRKCNGLYPPFDKYVLLRLDPVWGDWQSTLKLTAHSGIDCP
jgi:hypothetical protein